MMDSDLVASHVFAKHGGAACKQYVWSHYFCMCKVFGKHRFSVLTWIAWFQGCRSCIVCIAVVLILCIPA